MSQPPNRAIELARTVAGRYATLPCVQAVALGGSQAGGKADPGSDIDLYVYHSSDLALADRRAIVSVDSLDLELDNRYWEPGDEWVDAPTGILVDVMYRPTAWMESHLDDILKRFRASLGYTTCFWHNVRESLPLFDRTGWMAEIRRFAGQPYPEGLRQAILAKNHPVLRTIHSSYRRQLEKALVRGDRVSVNHRVAALLASVFDILFAFNRVTHPGEKRLVELACARCAVLPDGFAERMGALHSGKCGTLENIDALLDGLDGMLEDG